MRELSSTSCLILQVLGLCEPNAFDKRDHWLQPTMNEQPLSDDSKDFVSWGEFFRNTSLPSVVLVCLAVWLHGSDSLVMATMIPSIVGEVGGSSLVGWSISLYEMGSIVAGSTGALLTMRFGLRGPMSSAAFSFGLGCLISTFAGSMEQILAGRVLQGLGGGGLVAMAFIAVNTLFPRRYVARALATVSMLWGVSAFMGPLLGGVFVQYATWRVGFGAFALQAFALGVWIALRRGGERIESSDLETLSFPFARLGLLCLAVLAISIASIEESFVYTIIYVLVGLGCLAGYFISDSHASAGRLLPHHTLSLRSPAGATLFMVLTIAIATIGLMAFAPLLMSHIYGTTAMEAGYVVACNSIGWTLVAVMASGSPERNDRKLIRRGITIAVIAVMGFVYAVPHGPVWLIAVFATMQGGGLGLAWSFLFRLATGLVPKDEIGRISGAIPPIQRLGYALGAAYLGIIGNATGLQTLASREEAINAAHWIYLCSVPFALAAWAIMLILTFKVSSGK